MYLCLFLISTVACKDDCSEPDRPNQVGEWAVVAQLSRIYETGDTSTSVSMQTYNLTLNENESGQRINTSGVINTAPVNLEWDLYANNNAIILIERSQVDNPSFQPAYFGRTFEIVIDEELKQEWSYSANAIDSTGAEFISKTTWNLTRIQ